MNFENRIKKLEQKVNVIESNEIPKAVWQKLGIPTCMIESGIPDEEAYRIFENYMNEYYKKLAKEMNTTQEAAKKLYEKTNIIPTCVRFL